MIECPFVFVCVRVVVNESNDGRLKNWKESACEQLQKRDRRTLRLTRIKKWQQKYYTETKQGKKESNPAEGGEWQV